MGIFVISLLKEDETDQAIEEPDEIMHINRDSERLEYLHLFKLDISIRNMCIFQCGKNLSNIKFVSKCVGELRTYHGTYCKTLNNDQNMNYYNANNEDNINVKNDKGLDQVPDSPEDDINPAKVVEDTVPKQLLTSANRPQCNGKNERVNQTLVAKLRCKVNSTTKTPWTKLLEQVTYGYNNSPHDVTGFPPAYLKFGTLPYDSPLPNQVKLNYPPIQQARQIAVNRTIKHHKINKQRYDKHYVDDKFKVGDLVLYQNFSYPNSSKLQSPYNGPFKVVRKLSNVTYEIAKPNQYTGKLTDIIHSTRLKPFHSKSNFQLC
ncbi:transposon Tf2-6 polyprotein [Trichonephila clavipes]|nr:transposon Tf2-6 polyprotein [Trichonephila clavipes]